MNNSHEVVFDPLISFEDTNNISIANYVYLGPLVSVVGMATNVINIIIYVRHGLNESINISFLSLAASDLGCLLTVFWYGLGSNPLFLQLVDPAYIPYEFLNLTSAFPKAFFSKTAFGITVFITVERCLCIVAPLKIKHILTPKRTLVCILIIYTAGILNYFPHVYLRAMFLTWKNDPGRNRSVLGLGYGPDISQVVIISGSINTVTMVSSFGVLILSTIVLVFELQRKLKWRLSVTNSSSRNSELFLRRDKVIFKATCLLAVLVIICYLPQACGLLAVSVVPDLNINGRYVLLYGVVWSVSWLLETINSSSTMVIYYIVSSKYRNTFQEMFYFVFHKNERKKYNDME